MIEVLRAAAELQEFCRQQPWKNCVIGGIALLRWGAPRETVDVDLTLLTGFGSETAFVTTLLARYPSRIDEPVAFALARRVVLLRTPAGVGLDIALGGLPFEERAIERATAHAYGGGIVLQTCSAEDLVVMKAFAARPKDWLDIEGILVRQTGRLDWNYIVSQLRPLVELKEAPEIMDLLRQKRDEFEA